MRAHPLLVGGGSRDVTRLMESIPGLIAKDGAEGVFAAALPDGATAVVKIDDGAGRARTVVLLEALLALGAYELDAALFAVAVLGHGNPVGEVRPVVPS
jgi:L-asparaginase II